jgi:hypothetical protein
VASKVDAKVRKRPEEEAISSTSARKNNSGAQEARENNPFASGASDGKIHMITR